MGSTKTNKEILVLGASGATGRLVVQQLLGAGCSVKAVVRQPGVCAELFATQQHLTEVVGSINEFKVEEMRSLVAECSAVVCCLGHNLSFSGIFGKPRRLVTEAVRLVHAAAQSLDPPRKLKFILMNSSGCRNEVANEVPPLSQRIAVGLIRWLVPPHADNELAADYLSRVVGDAAPEFEWVAVRPDGLIDAAQITDYEVVPSPLRNAIFDAGQTSRINVAHFMHKLVLDDVLWAHWRSQMPVIYNQESVPVK